MACAPSTRSSVSGTPPAPTVERSTRHGEFSFRDHTASPEAAAEDPALPPCGEPDGALGRVARWLGDREARGLPWVDSAELAFALRAEGSPHVWPHAWAISVTPGDRAAVEAGARRFLASFAEGGTRRCGAARVARGADTEVVTLVAVDVLADLERVPTTARMGQWISIVSRLRVPARAAKVVVLGPVGPPRPVPTSLHDGVVRATFAADQPGPWTAQLLLTVDSGPRPAIEAMIFVDAPPPSEFLSWPAPGESRAGGALDDRDALRSMIEAVHEDAALPPLRPSPVLDQMAQSHAEDMRAAKRLAHDLGAGDPQARARAAGLEPVAIGENVAHALSLTRAHRALWASPSHRGNLLDPRFGSVGVGAARDPDGGVWVCEVFADFGRAGIGP